MVLAVSPWTIKIDSAFQTTQNGIGGISQAPNAV